jgi:cation diffusion facilitator CzcD-associated flavoprotein CzcO
MGKRTETGVVIVGTGYSGLGMAIQLRKEGREDFVILEKADDVGGTWRDNTYPGCACDVPSHMYSFSFEQNAGWSRAYAGQREIWDYLRDVAEKYDLRRFIRFGQEMTGARWDEDSSQWNVSTRTGEEFAGKFLVTGTGVLHLPQIPELPGIETFQGTSFHSAQWDHDFDLEGKKVAVVGTGASAIQFVPQIAAKVAELSVFQRTPPWIMPKPDRDMPVWVRRAFRSVPLLQRAYRNLLYWALEVRALGFNGHPGVLMLGERIARRHLGKQIADPELRRTLTPDYRLGCKRVLLSNDYYPALGRESVKVITHGVAEVRAHSIVDGAGVSRAVDAIIYGTGFHVTDAFDDLDIVGKGGRNLGEEWSTEGMRTHLGITVSGYPNLFLLLGPNTGLGHNSVVFMIESQILYVAAAIRMVERSGAKSLEAREHVQARSNTEIQRKLSKGIWTQGGCTSWYLDAEGVNRAIWPGFTWRYWLDTRKVKAEDFELLSG